MIYLIWILSAVYCICKLHKRYQKTDLGGGIGISPGLDTIMVVMLAPLLASIDIIVSWFSIYKKAEKQQTNTNDTKIDLTEAFRNEETHIY